MANFLIADPEGATISLMVTELTSGASPGLSPGGGGFGGPETITSPTTVYLANSGEVLVSMVTRSGAEVASPQGKPLRVMVSGTVVVKAHLDNETQASHSLQVGGWPGDMRPFANHWYGPRIAGTFSNTTTSAYQHLVFTPLTIVDGAAKFAFMAGTSTSDPVTVALYNSDGNNWPSTLVWSTTVSPVTGGTGVATEVDGPDVSGAVVTLPDGLYWATVVSFDDSGFLVYGFDDYNSGYSPVNYAPHPSYGTDASIVLNSLLVGSAGQCVIHATNIGGDSAATVTSLPTTITPGVDNGGTWYMPLIIAKSAWGG